MKVNIYPSRGDNPGGMHLTPENDADNAIIADMKKAFVDAFPRWPQCSEHLFPEEDGVTKLELPFLKL